MIRGYIGVIWGVAEGECLGPTSIRNNLRAIKNLIQIPTPIILKTKTIIQNVNLKP
jgi:hypothetical protein